MASPENIKVTCVDSNMLVFRSVCNVTVVKRVAINMNNKAYYRSVWRKGRGV